MLLPASAPEAAAPDHAAGADTTSSPSADIVACVVPVFTSALAFFTVADPQSENQAQTGTWLASEARDTFEDSYQAAKAALLHAGAGGAVDVNAVYDWLARLSDLRRAVELGFKAAQRLATLPDLPPLPSTEGAPKPPPQDTAAHQ